MGQLVHRKGKRDALFNNVTQRDGLSSRIWIEKCDISKHKENKPFKSYRLIYIVKDRW